MAAATGIAAAGQALDEAHIDWAVLRLTFDPSQPSGDVDLLLAPGATDRAIEKLIAVGFVPLDWTIGASRSVVRLDEPEMRWSWIDLHEHLAIGGHRMSDDAVRDILSRRRHAQGLWLLDPADEFWGLIGRIVVDGRALEPRHETRLRELLPEVRRENDVAQLIERAVDRPGLAEHALDLVRDGAWDRLRKLSGRSRRQGLSVDGPRRLLTALRALRRPGRRGLSVALLGPDGAGKSTLAAWLEMSYPFTVRRIYMGVGPPPGTPRRPLVISAPAAVAGLSLQWLRFLAGRYHQLRGRLVIFDRYMEDPWLPLPRNATIARRVGRRVRAAISCPPADLMLVLDAPGTEMFTRKGEHSATLLEEQRQRYLRLGDRMANVVVLDATTGQREVQRETAGLIWRRYRQLHGYGAPISGGRPVEEPPITSVGSRD